MRLSYAQAVKVIQTRRREIAVRNSNEQRLARLSAARRGNFDQASDIAPGSTCIST